jgi:exodeoxyribonuclease VII large subunit
LRHPDERYASDLFSFSGSSPLDRKIWTVSQLTSEIKEILEESFAGIWVEGEISNFRQPSSGHMYFTLKDEASQIGAVMFRSLNRTLRFRPEDGLAALAFGTVSVYERRGEYQINVEYLEPKGLGALQLAYEQLKERLAQEGLFDPAHKKGIPLLPQRIGVITSPTGAAIRDILQVIRRRVANVQIVLYPVQVQGETAAEEIARGIEEMNRHGHIDVLIVGRGGGSIEDLWAFNQERVARAIFASQIPILSAVGHETDYTIADFVADVRAPTPSAAAEIVVAHKDQLRQRVDELMSRFHSLLRFLLQSRATSLSHLKGRLQAFSPQGILRLQRQRFSALEDRLERGSLAYLQGRRELLRRTVEKLEVLSPLSVLQRGFSICMSLSSQQIIRDASEVQAGDGLLVRLHRGKIQCEVKGRET